LHTLAYMLKNLNSKKVIVIGLVFAFLANSLGPMPFARADEFYLPVPGKMVALSPAYSPAVLKGIKLDPKNPFRFHFFVDTGDSPTRGHVPEGDVSPSRLPTNEPLKVKASQGNNQTQNEELRTEATKLIKYFLASLTIPEKDLWVTY